jgi:hypothetical protein
MLVSVWFANLAWNTGSVAAGMQKAHERVWVLHPVAHLSNWFLMMPSIATKSQYVNSFLFSFFLTTCFGPYGPSSGEIYNWMLQWTISNTTDPLHVRDPIQRCYMLHIGAPTLHSQYMLSQGNNVASQGCTGSCTTTDSPSLQNRTQTLQMTWL